MKRPLSHPSRISDLMENNFAAVVFILLLVMVLMTSPTDLQAAAAASDSAENYMGDFDEESNPNGWGIGVNGGSGFGPWTVLNGQFLNNYDPTMSTIALDGPSVFAYNGFSSGSAIRSFTGNLEAGDTFQVQMQIENEIGKPDAGAGCGFILTSKNGKPFTARYDFAKNILLANDLVVGNVTGKEFETGVSLTFTMGSETAWTFTARSISNPSITTTVSGSGVDQLNSLNIFTNAIGSNRIFFNSLSVTNASAR